jgi:autotransporter translocation and assembly factor TamB
MKKIVHSLAYYVIVWSLIIFFMAISSSIILLQTSYGKEKIKNYFLFFAKKNNFDLKIKNVSGLLPFEYKLNDVEINYNNIEIKVDKIKFRIKFLPLLTKNLTFKLFEATNISYEIKQSSDLKTISSNKDNWISPIINIHFQNIKLNDLNIAKHEKLTLNLNGSLKVKKHGKVIKSDFKIYRKNFLDTNLNVSSIAKKDIRSFEISILLNSKNLKAFYPYISKDFDSSFEMLFTSKGKLDSYISYLQNKNISSDITGRIDLEIDTIKSKNKNLDFILNQKSDFDIKFKTKQDLSIHFYNGKFRNDLLTLFIDSTIDKKFNFLSSALILKIDNLSKLNEISPFLLKGSITSTIKQNKNDFTADLKANNFYVKNISFSNLDLTSKCTYLNNQINGNLNFIAFAFNQPFNLSSDFQYEKSNLDFKNITASAPSSKLNGNIKINPNLTILGELNAHFDDLSQIKVFYPKTDYNGVVDIKANFNQHVVDEKSFSKIDLNIKATNYYLSNVFGKNLNLDLEILDPFKTNKIKSNLIANDLTFHELNLKALKLNFNEFDKNNPFSIQADGSLKKELSLKANGFFKYNNEIEFDIKNLSLLAFSYPFAISNSTKFIYKKDQFILKDFNLHSDDSKFQADINLSKDKSMINLDINHFPIDFLSINPLDLDISGFITSKVNLSKQTFLNGNIELDLIDFLIKSMLDEKPLLAKGNVIAEIDKNLINLKSNLFVKDFKLLDITSTLPLNVNFFPLKIDIDKNKKLQANFEYNGKVEELLDFINIGAQSLQGDLNSQINLSNKIDDLKVSGFIHFKNGNYENYYLGTNLKDINATFLADKNKLTLTYLHANDLKNGSLNAKGNFSLSYEKKFPYKLNLIFKNLNLLNTDNIQTNVTANLEVKGNRLSADAKGLVTLDQTNLIIPNEIPKKPINLNEEYIYHPNQDELKIKTLSSSSYPIFLNFEIGLENPIKVTGAGLNSSWDGHLTLSGTYQEFKPKGKLNLIKGSYVFSGRNFILHDGEVNFSGKVNEIPNLSLKSSMQQAGIDIIANLDGPLDTPKITFTSKPPLSASSIMSLLLFGRELSDLSVDETIALSNAMNKKLDPESVDSSSSLGVDRFNVDSDDESKSQSIQLGKYLTKGVVVSFSQGEEQGSSNIIVEVDLKHGFVFQAETQQQEEQGKFTIKYRHNY